MRIANSTTYDTAKPGILSYIHDKHEAHLESLAHSEMQVFLSNN